MPRTRFPGFVGPSYRSQSVNADCQMTMNWYPEQIESGDGASPIVLYPTPGLKLFCDLSNGVAPTTRGLFSINGRQFGACGVEFSEMSSAGVKTVQGNILNDTSLCSFASSPQQLLFSSAGTAYVFDLVANTLNALPANTFSGPVSLVGYSDGFFLALIADTGKFYVSSVLNATDWTTNGAGLVSIFPDTVISMLVDHREIWFFSATKTAVYFNSGGAFPFTPVPGGFIEQGTAAKLSPARLDNTIFWLGSDDRGKGIVWRASGYTPQRVSNHAVEFAIQSYKQISDATGFAYQDQGHNFYVLYFPTADKTWCYDVNTQLWHERGYWQSNIGQFSAARYRCHNFNPTFGKHLVGDWKTGKVYDMSINYLDDAGNAIRRVRRAPHVAKDRNWVFHKELEPYFETGLGPQPPLLDGDGNPRDPQAMLRFSNDAGHTWSNELVRDCGQAGQFKKRAMFRRLGRARDRVYEISVTDPIPWRLVDAFIDVEVGIS